MRLEVRIAHALAGPAAALLVGGQGVPAFCQAQTRPARSTRSGRRGGFMSMPSAVQLLEDRARRRGAAGHRLDPVAERLRSASGALAIRFITIGAPHRWVTRAPRSPHRWRRHRPA